MVIYPIEVVNDRFYGYVFVKMNSDKKYNRCRFFTKIGKKTSENLIKELIEYVD